MTINELKNTFFKVDKCEKDILFFVNECKHKYKAGNKIENFTLYPFQEKLIEQISNNKYNIGLTSRQVGLTTITSF